MIQMGCGGWQRRTGGQIASICPLWRKRAAYSIRRSMNAELPPQELWQSCARIQLRRAILQGRLFKSTCSPLCRNCVKTLSHLAVGISFERNVDAPTYCKERMIKGSDGGFGAFSTACNRRWSPARASQTPSPASVFRFSARSMLPAGVQPRCATLVFSVMPVGLRRFMPSIDVR